MYKYIYIYCIYKVDLARAPATKYIL